MHEQLPLLHTALQWLECGEQTWLLHVAHTWGSSPRPPGSLMLLRADGRHLGSVSGGCVEGDLFERLQQGRLDPRLPARIEYGSQDNPQVRLPCRSTLQLVVEPLHGPEPLQAMIDAIEQRRPLWRRLDLASGKLEYHSPRQDQGVHYDGRTLGEYFGPQWRALLIGANDLAGHVARQCLALGYEVLVCDPREEYRDQWHEPGTRLLEGMPDEAAAEYLQDERCALLALTHDPRLDDMALVQALPGPAFYVGALGSRRSAERRHQTLKQMGLSEAQTRKLDAPIGVDIGSHTPAEIAVSIAARLIQVRNRQQQSQRPSLRTLSS